MKFWQIMTPEYESDYQSAFINGDVVHSTPTADFLWPARDVIVSDRIRRRIETRFRRDVAFTRVKLRRIDSRVPASPVPIAATGEPEELDHRGPATGRHRLGRFLIVR